MRRKIMFIAAGTAIGIVLWLAARGLQALSFPALAELSEWLRLIANAGGEELLRLCMAIAIAILGSRLGMRSKESMYLVLSSCVFAGLEHLSYIKAFPDTATLWRVGYAGPIHPLAAAAYALALTCFPAGKPRIAASALALGAAWLWHAGFNLAAAYLDPKAAAPAGTILNLAALAALFALMEYRLNAKGYIDGRA